MAHDALKKKFRVRCSPAADVFVLADRASVFSL